MNRMLRTPSAPSRREVLVVGATLAGGSLLVGCSLPDMLSAGSKVEPGAFGAFIRIAPDGMVTVVSKHIEFGQGNHAGLAAIVAEELDADWSKVKVEQAPANAKLYGNGLMGGTQGTGGSSAISDSWPKMRAAGAAARAMFVQAAATAWGVPAAEVGVKDGVLSHPSGRRAGFGEMLEAAAKVAPPAQPVLKDAKAFTLIGSDRVRRKDSQAKSDGTARYTQDVRLPGMLTAMVAHPPKFGAKVKAFDAAEAKKVPGVVAVHEIPSGVAVVADNTWAARLGRDALKVDWDESKAETRGSDQILSEFRDYASGKRGAPGKAKWASFVTRGDTAQTAGGTAAVELAYDFPYLAHAAMEPMNCVATVGDGPTRLVFGSQAPTLDQINVAMVTPALPGSIEIETLFAGGSFGRRTTFGSDYVVECVQIAKKMKRRPVKLVWTREDDMRAGYFRPLVHHTVRVTVDAEGFPATWRHRIVTQSILKDAPPGAPVGGDVDMTAVEGVVDSPYLKATPVVDAQLLTPDVGVPVLWWRSVGATHTAYVMEHTIDQLARRAGQDPVEYRRALYRKAGANRHLAVLDLVAEKAGWATPSSDSGGWTRGVAVHECFGSVVAQVAEVKVEDGVPKVGRVVTAIDCGTAIAPDQVAAQMEGGTCYGLSGALFGEITLTGGSVDQGNFDSYRVLRHSEAPIVETHILPSANPPSGVGEPGTPVIGPAVANALLALTGRPTLSQPFVKA